MIEYIITGSESTAPIQAFVENKGHPNYGGFTIPLPTTREKIQPFLDCIKIKSEAEAAVTDVLSEINGLAKAVLPRGSGGPRLSELNYLAARIRQLDDNERETLSAVLAAGRHSGNVAKIINLTENIGIFHLQPAYSTEQYGDFLLQEARDNTAEAFERLEKSDDPVDRELAAHILELEAHVDAKIYGRPVVADGLFTKYGYLLNVGAAIHDVYRGPEDIPDEYRIWEKSPAKTLTKVENIDLGALLTQMCAAGGDHTRNQKDVLRSLADGGRDYLVLMNDFLVSVVPTGLLYHKEVLGNSIRQCLQAKQETRSFAIYVIRRQSGWIAGDLYEMDLRHFADEKQLAAHLDILRQSRPETYAAAPAGEFIARLNEPFMAQASNPQPGMLRVAPEAARVMLVRSEGVVYRLCGGGPAPLSAIDAVKGDLWRSGEFAVWRHDAAALEKWASRSAAETLRYFERGEHNKNHGMEV